MGQECQECMEALRDGGVQDQPRHWKSTDAAQTARSLSSIGAFNNVCPVGGDSTWTRSAGLLLRETSVSMSLDRASTHQLSRQI